MRHPLPASARALAALVLLATGAPAQAQCTHAKLLADDRASTDVFGYAVSMSQIPAGNAPSMLIGAWSDDNAGGGSAGAAYIFHRGVNGWMQDEKIVASDGAAGDFFGTAVGYEYPWAIVGAPGAGTAGRSYIYYHVGSGPIPWWEVAAPVPNGSQAGDDVGRAVDITDANGGWAIVGAPLRDFDFNSFPGTSDADAGAAYFFRFEGGTFVQKTSAPFRLVLPGFSGGEWAATGSDPRWRSPATWPSPARPWPRRSRA